MEAENIYTDVELLEKIKLSDQAAFKEIYNRYCDLLFAYAYRRLKSKEEAKDVVQDVFSKLWERRHSFQLKTYLSGYLYKSVLNKILDIWKHNKIVRDHVLNQAVEIDVDSVETDFFVREKEVTAMIEKEISAMPARMRAVYELRFKEYYSVKEIADELAISENTVATQIQRALAHLRKKLGLIIYIVYILEK